MRPMRRQDRARGREFCLELIDNCTHGVVALDSGEDTPYCLPLTLTRVDNCLYFHGAKEGRKTDLLRRNPKVCITFVGRDDPTYRDGDYTTLFASAIVTGTAYEVTEDEEKIMALETLCRKVLPDHMDGDKFQRAIDASLKFTAVWRIEMEHISGKAKD